jgi:hypothetical protein
MLNSKYITQNKPFILIVILSWREVNASLLPYWFSRIAANTRYLRKSAKMPIIVLKICRNSETYPPICPKKEGATPAGL